MKGAAPRAQAARATLGELWATALGSFDVSARVAAQAARFAERMGAPDLVIAVGKMAGPMLRATAHVAQPGARLLAVAPEDAPLPQGLSFTALRAGHPLPDAGSVRAVQAISKAVAQSTRVLLLLSGGASSLLGAGLLELRLQRALVRALLSSGADIRSINCVRRRLQLLSGGRLALLCHPRPVATVAVSDVLGGTLADIGSGPTLADPTSLADARAVLRRAHIPEPPRRAWLRSLGPGDRHIKRASFALAASPSHLLTHVAQTFEAHGIACKIQRSALGTADALAKATLRQAASSVPCVLRSSESSVSVRRGSGKGGRCTHVAALVAAGLPPTHVFLAGATDGVDGASGTAGAIVDATCDGPALREAIAAYDTGAFFKRRGMALPQAPTGQNFADVTVLLRIT